VAKNGGRRVDGEREHKKRREHVPNHRGFFLNFSLLFPCSLHRKDGHPFTFIYGHGLRENIPNQMDRVRDRCKILMASKCTVRIERVPMPNQPTK
jgi:hypothetical protein